MRQAGDQQDKKCCKAPPPIRKEWQPQPLHQPHWQHTLLAKIHHLVVWPPIKQGLHTTPQKLLWGILLQTLEMHPHSLPGIPDPHLLLGRRPVYFIWSVEIANGIHTLPCCISRHEGWSQRCHKVGSETLYLVHRSIWYIHRELKLFDRVGFHGTKHLLYLSLTFYNVCSGTDCVIQCHVPLLLRFSWGVGSDFGGQTSTSLQINRLAVFILGKPACLVKKNTGWYLQVTLREPAFVIWAPGGSLGPQTTHIIPYHSRTTPAFHPMPVILHQSGGETVPGIVCCHRGLLGP